VVGSTDSDVITLTGADDIACGLGGADWIDCSAGRDRIYGGDDNDDIRGGTGNDPYLSGGEDDDILWGDKGNAGGPYGNDTLRGGQGADELHGEGQTSINGDTGWSGNNPGDAQCDNIESTPSGVAIC
jgi:Ca2+-binding RTX toxin-like protein